MKILFIADLHDFVYENINNIVNLDFDYCMLLGDINKVHVLYISNIIKKPCFGIVGNHDMFNTLDGTGIENIAFKTINLDGYNILGIDGGIRYKRGMYAMYTQEELLEKCNNLPKVDILISHETGYHYLKDDLVHEGFKAIDEYILKNEPKYNIFGHYHQQYNFMKNNTRCICVYQFIILDVDTGNIEYIF